MSLSVAFCLIADLATLLGVRKINELKGAWECIIDDNWIIAVNGTKQTVESRPEGTMGADIPPVHAAVWYNGWLASLMTPSGGCFAAGSAANEDTFIEALTARIKIERTKAAS